MSEALLDVSALAAGYLGRDVLHDVDLGVGAGEVVAVLGPNGAGKSTLLLTIAGVVRPTSGSVRLFGAEARGRSVQQRARRGLGFVPADRGLFVGLTARENIRVFSRDRSAVGRAIETFPRLEAVLDRRVGLLSGGEQQMLTIATVLITRPRLLMIDEMSMGLAPVVVRSLLPAIRRVADEDGVGVLIVEQHAAEALEVSDRIVVMHQGRVVHEATSAAVTADPERLASLYLSGTDGDAKP